MSFKNRWTISSSYDVQAHRSVPKEDDVFPDCSAVFRSSPRLVVAAASLVVGAPRRSQACCRRSQVLPDAPEGHCIVPVNSRIRPPWDSGPTTLGYSQRLPVTKIHFVDTPIVVLQAVITLDTVSIDSDISNKWNGILSILSILQFKFTFSQLCSVLWLEIYSVKLFSYLCGIFKLGILFPKGYSLLCYIVL